MEITTIKKVHCLGIGGIGVSAVAKFFLAQGKTVTGSDMARSEITEDLEKRGVKIFFGHRAENLDDDVDLVIYSPSVPLDNPERLKIKRLKDYKIIEELSYPEFLGELSKDYYTIAVSGTHGKSTTTALIGLMLEGAGLDPLVIVGGKVPGWELGNIRLSQKEKSRYFVVEACEHQANMLKIHPQAVVITNMEPDHLDYYKTFDNIKAAFQQFTRLVPKGGLVVFNGDREPEWNWNYARPGILKLLWQMLFGMKLKWRSFGFNERNDYRATDVSVSNDHQFFNIQSVSWRTAFNILKISLNIPGRFNIYNVLAAVTVALELGVPAEVCQKVLVDFKGIWRRFEIVGYLQNQPLNPIPYTLNPTIISDYGHHPTAIRETIQAAREFYPGQRIVLVFQPHQHHRTKSLFDDFVKALTLPDVLILSEIYDVAGREETVDQDVSSELLVERIKGVKVQGLIEYGGDLERTEQKAREIIREGDVVIVMGAGDIDGVARNLVKKS